MMNWHLREGAQFGDRVFDMLVNSLCVNIGVVNYLLKSSIFGT